MRVVVLGGGVIGVSTAYYLALRGAEVVVVERREALGQETSAVNAGLLSPGHTFTWASPRAPRTLVRSLAGKDTALRMHWRPDFSLYAWGLQFLANCTTERARVNTLRRLRLAQFSKNAFDALANELDIDFHKLDHGALFLFRTQKAMDIGVERLALLGEHGEPQEILDADGVVAREPAFAPVKDRIRGAVYSASTSSGDSAMFTEGLAAKCREMGVEFRMGTSVDRFVIERGRVTGVETSAGLIGADKYVIAMGVWSRKLARTAHIRLPIYPVKGYTLTAPVADPQTAPVVSGIDEDRLVAWSRFGDNLRMTGTADFAGYRTDINERDTRAIFATASELFPDVIRWEDRQMRVGLRPVTANEVPILGPSQRHPQIVLNVGHGNLGWVMSVGSGQLVADLTLGRRPSLNPATLEPIT